MMRLERQELRPDLEAGDALTSVAIVRDQDDVCDGDKTLSMEG